MRRKKRKEGGGVRELYNVRQRSGSIFGELPKQGNFTCELNGGVLRSGGGDQTCM
jgi:hypothetical protein